MIEVHYKTTVWNSVSFPEGTKVEDIIKTLEEGYRPSELDTVEGVGPDDLEYSTIHDTEEYITPEENDGESTIKVMTWNEEGFYKPVWTNSFQDTADRLLKDLTK